MLFLFNYKVVLSKMSDSEAKGFITQKVDLRDEKAHFRALSSQIRVTKSILGHFRQIPAIFDHYLDLFRTTAVYISFNSDKLMNCSGHTHVNLLSLKFRISSVTSSLKSPKSNSVMMLFDRSSDFKLYVPSKNPYGIFSILLLLRCRYLRLTLCWNVHTDRSVSSFPAAGR